MQRFWDQVEKTDGCWNWTGTKTRGYGRFKIRQRAYMAHRLSYEWAYGPIPEGMFVCHRCDNPSCVRPDHLFVGTAAENNRDRELKKRGASRKGTLNRRAKLTDDDVLKIRELAARGVTHTSLASEYGVARSLIGMVARGVVWGHIGGPRTAIAPTRSNSGFRGVSWDRRRQQFQVYVDHNGKRCSVGRAQTAEDGARLHDRKARELGVPNHRLNFPD